MGILKFIESIMSMSSGSIFLFIIISFIVCFCTLLYLIWYFKRPLSEMFGNSKNSDIKELIDKYDQSIKLLETVVFKIEDFEHSYSKDFELNKVHDSNRDIALREMFNDYKKHIENSNKQYDFILEKLNELQINDMNLSRDITEIKGRSERSVEELIRLNSKLGMMVRRDVEF